MTGRLIADALDRNFTSPNSLDSNGEAANVVDGLYRIGDGLFAIAKSLGQLAEEQKYLGQAITELTQAVNNHG